MKSDVLEEIADALVADLFRNGQGNQAVRLALIDERGQELGGWGRGPVRVHVLTALRSGAAAAGEAMQDQEAILRLALAFRAVAADQSGESDGGPVYELAWRMADYLEKPDEARAAIEREKDRERRTRRTR
jgi:hypothetical protein